MKDCRSGVVSTPRKSETIASMRPAGSAIFADDLVVAEALAPFQRPAEEGDLGLLARAPHPGGADQRAGPTQRLALFPVDPELQGRASLDAVRPVLGREQGLGDLHRGAVG